MSDAENPNTLKLLALERARQVRDHLKSQIAGYSSLEVPSHLRIQLADQIKFVAQLEREIFKETSQTPVISEDDVTTIKPLHYWWIARGYKDHPFYYHKAGDIPKNFLTELCQDWCIDPIKKYPDIIDRIGESQESHPILIFSQPGGGKTFYRRWAAQLVERKYGRYHAIEIRNLSGEVRDLRNVTSNDLALCIYRAICRNVNATDEIETGLTTEQILSECEKLLESMNNFGPVYIFIDDINRLFSSKGSEQNIRSFNSLREFCLSAAQREGDLFTLRIFIPAQFEKLHSKDPYFSESFPPEYICKLDWDFPLCQKVVIQRLKSYYQSIADEEKLESSYLTDLFDAAILSDIATRYKKPGSITPGKIINLFHQLVLSTFARIDGNSRIPYDLWCEFISNNKRLTRMERPFHLPPG
jgi:hypothetical protein